MKIQAYDRNKESPEPTDQIKPHIMIVDDEVPVQRLLSRILKPIGNECTLAASSEEARSYMSNQKFDLILCDVKMPGESGIDFIQYILTNYPETAVIMVTAVDDPKTGETALDLGAYGYIIKPFTAQSVRINVSNALRRRKLEIQQRFHCENLEQLVSDGTALIQKMLEESSKANEEIIQAMALAIETRDPYTAGHQRRVADLAYAIGSEMRLSEQRIVGIHMAGIIHDLGKICVPAEILSKPGPLNEYEFGMIKLHPQVGYNILKKIDFPWPIAQMVYQHHERINGTGYPQGLKGKKILLEARILSVADVVEAMASHRPYRPALGVDKALETILEEKNVLFDPEVVNVCLKLFKENGFEFSD
jgi:putative two-component system response regulator